MNQWSQRDVREAAKLVAEREAIAAAGTCPVCGAAATVDLIESYTQSGDYAFRIGERRCSARCWETNPDGYLAAVGDAEA